MADRVSPRRPRRVQVQFWKRGEPHPFPGYTTNISMTGMFIAARNPFPPGTRLRIEVLEGDRGFVIEGVVAHARKVPAEMIRVSTPGMGIRFLTVEELVRELIPVGHGIEDLPGFRPDQPDQAPSPPASLAPPSPPAPSAPKVLDGGGTFSVHFLSPGEFVEVFRRDISNGGLFVSTRYPGRLQETVSVELHPPFPGAEPVLARARVVQRFEPSAEGSPNLLSGMGVELLDLPDLMEKLKRYVER